MKPQEKKLKTIDTGGFYAGLYEPTFEENPTLDSLYSFQDKINKQLDIVSIYLAWNPNMDEFPGELLRQIELNQKIPMITWEPWSVKFENDSSENIFIGITKGTYNSYLDNFIDQIKKLDVPVFLRFAHEADNPMYPWSKAQPEQFKRAWQFLYHYFNQAGAYNVIWLWNPWKPSAFSSYFPGEDYVDWIGVTLLNYGLASPDSTWYTFEQLYHPIQQEIKKLPAKPVMLAEFGSTAYGGDRQLWLGEAFKKIKSYPEIKAITFFNSDQDNNWPGETSLINTSIDWKIKSDEAWVLLSSIFDDNHFVNNFAHVFSEKKSKKKVYPSSTEVIIPGNIKGVVYNPEDVFRKELLPLTRNQLEIDFNSIKLLGANTISRYTSNIYDHNVVAIAEEYDLQVIFGFDFSAKVDFSDPKSRQELSEKILSTTRKFQSSESIIIWNLGNTLYNDFAKYFDKPKLNLVRRHYLTFIDSLSKQIKVITPQVPVMISLNCDEMLMNTLLHIKEIDPAIDIIGINAYYEKYLQNLEEVMLSSGINKPYFISELGHSGYWQHDLNSIQRFDLLREPSGQQKIRCLVENWEKYVLAKPTANLGAVINRWRDNLNGTLTWSGLNDIYGRKKPEYFAIRALWNNEPVELPGYSLKILMPVARLQPQVNYEITGIVTDRSGMVLFKDHSAFKYEWYVSIEEEGKVIDIKALMQKPSIKYSPWFSEKNHRLHVFAEDSEGNVFTASEAFLPY